MVSRKFAWTHAGTFLLLAPSVTFTHLIADMHAGAADVASFPPAPFASCMKNSSVT